MSPRKRKELPALSPSVQAVAESEDMLLWAMEHVKRVDNHDFNFTDRKYLIEIYQDEAPFIAVKKATQRGLSTWAMLKSMHRVIKRKRNAIYYLPTDGDMRTFVQSRFDTLIAQNHDLYSSATNTDNTQVKNFNNCMLHFRGMKSLAKLSMIPADIIVEDETDLVDGEVKLEIAKERIGASLNPEIIMLSKPSFPDFAIDKAYQTTDRKEYCIKCSHCGKWTEPSELKWPDRFEAGYVMCKCRHKLDYRVDQVQWVPQWPSVKNASGWWVPAFISPRFNFKGTLEAFRKVVNVQNFYNAVLGLAYSDRDSKLTDTDILSLCGDWEMPGMNAEEATAGVDVGKYLHVVISRPGHGGMREIVYLGELGGEGKKPWEDLHVIFRRHNVRRYVIDRMPETDSAEEFVSEHRDAEGWTCLYEGVLKPTWNKDARVVKVDRTNSLDKSQAILRYRKVVLPRRCHDVEVFARHCSNVAKKEQNDEKKGERWYEYVQGGPDHYRHAFNYDVIAWMPRDEQEDENDWDGDFDPIPVL